MAGERISFLDKIRQIPQLAELHDQMYVCSSLLAVDERHDVWMMEAFQDVNLGVEVVLELLVELFQVDRFDGHVPRALLTRLVY